MAKKSVSETRRKLNEHAMLCKFDDSLGLDELGEIAVEYLKHEYRLGKCEGTNMDDLMYSLGLVLGVSLKCWKPFTKAEFSRYLFVNVIRKAHRIYHQDKSKERLSCDEGFLDDMSVDYCPSDEMMLGGLLSQVPDDDFGKVIMAYVECWTASISPTPTTLARFAGLPTNVVMRMLPDVAPWVNKLTIS